MSTSKRDFQAIADALAGVRPEAVNPERPMWDACEQAVIGARKKTNPLFDEERFAAWAEGSQKLGEPFGPRSTRRAPLDLDAFGPEFDGNAGEEYEPKHRSVAATEPCIRCGTSVKLKSLTYGDAPICDKCQSV